MTLSIDALLKDLGTRIARYRDATVILFGSFARGDARRDSDVDLLVICHSRNRKRISNIILDLGKEHDRVIQAVFSDPDLSGFDANFIDTLLREGRPVAGSMPGPTLDRMELKPFRILHYTLRNISQSGKMRLRYELFGGSTEKTIGPRTYTSTKDGLLATTGGRRLGSGSLLIPESTHRQVQALLRKHGATVRSIPVWLPAAH